MKNLYKPKSLKVIHLNLKNTQIISFFCIHLCALFKQKPLFFLKNFLVRFRLVFRFVQGFWSLHWISFCLDFSQKWKIRYVHLILQGLQKNQLSEKRRKMWLCFQGQKLFNLQNQNNITKLIISQSFWVR